MLLVLDNYDSFTYNLVQYAGELGADPVVYRNDALTVEAALALRPTAIVISPGPCTPREAGISVPLVRAAAGRVPVLGVCLGHQAIGEAFGGQGGARRPAHAREDHDGAAHRPSAVPGRPRPVRGHAVPLAGGLPRGTARRSSRSRPGPTTVRRAAKSWRCATARSRSSASSFTPSPSPRSRANACSQTSSSSSPNPLPLNSIAE